MLVVLVKFRPIQGLLRGPLVAIASSDQSLHLAAAAAHMVERLERRTVQVQVVVLVMESLVEPLEPTVIKVAMVALFLLGILALAVVVEQARRRQTQQAHPERLVVLDLHQV